MIPTRPALFALCLALTLSMAAQAQPVLSKLSTSTQQELKSLSPADRAGLGRELTGEPAGHDGNEALCTRWGCIGGSLDLGVEDWHASPEGTLTDRDPSPFVGLEAAAPIPSLQDYGVGAQIYAGYSLVSRQQVFFAAGAPRQQQQQLYSVGLFRRPDLNGPWYSRWGLGLAHDFSINQFAGEFSQTYELEQWRAKASYELTDAHEVGVWGAMHSGAATLSAAAGLPLYYRPVDQLNFFYKYNLPDGGSLSAYIGPGVGSHYPMLVVASQHPYNGLLWTFGGAFDFPVSRYVGVFAGLGYGIPRAEGPADNTAAATRIYSVQAGLRWFWGGNGKVRADTGRRWMAYLPAPDNGNFAAQANISE